MFGPYERQIGDWYRAIYIDLDALIALMLAWRPAAGRILEVGCGEGAVTERLRTAYPDADITAIDINPRLGRLYRGSCDRLRFIRCGVGDIGAAQARGYDFIVLSDVLHHVPVENRPDLIDGVRQAMAANGALFFKDWQRSYAPIHWMCHASDRWLTGDEVAYLSRDEMRDMLATTFGAAAVVAEKTVAPWRNNLAFLVQP